MSTIVTVNAQGRLTIPASIRRELGIEGESTLIVEIEDGRLIARPGVVVPTEDAWYYTPEHQARLAEAKAQAEAGQTFRLTEEELRTRIRLPATSSNVRKRESRLARRAGGLPDARVHAEVP